MFHRPYAGGEKDWRFIGETPLVDVAVPIGVGLWRLEKEGHDTALLALRNPGLQLGNAPDADVRLVVEGVDLTIPLADSATSPDGMVLVPMIPALIPGIARRSRRGACRSSSIASRSAIGISRNSSTPADTPRPTTGGTCRSTTAANGGPPSPRSST